MNKLFGMLSLILLFCLSSELNAQKKNITIMELPKVSQEFIYSYFPDMGGVNVKMEVKPQKTEYEVKFSKGFEIEFDGNGNWKEVESKNNHPIPTGFISKRILSYISSNYKDSQIVKIEKEKSKYEVKLDNGIELEFDLSGNFLRID